MANPQLSSPRPAPFLLLLIVAMFLPDPSLPLLVWAACRLAHGGRLADLGFFVLFLSVRLSRLSPPGSAARRWARFSIFVASSSIMLGIPWSLDGPPTFEAVVWGIAAFGVLGLLYVFLFY